MGAVIFDIIFFSSICVTAIYAYMSYEGIYFTSFRFKKKHIITKMPEVFALNDKYLEQSLTFINSLSNIPQKSIYVDCYNLKNITDEAYIIYNAKIEKEGLVLDENLFISHKKILEKKLATAYYAHKYSNINEIIYEMEKDDEDNPDDIYEYLMTIKRLGLKRLRQNKHNLKTYLQPSFIHKNQKITDKSIGYSNFIDVNLIAELIDELKSSIRTNDTFEPLYDLLVELLGNAAEHGIKNKNINWWMHKYSDVNTQAMHFAFVDMGGGIINSYKESNLLKEKDIKSESDILLNALQGRLGSTTGKPGRGNGMPLILENIEKEWISNFFLITNSVSLRYINGTFRVSETPFFIGTYYSWSISKNNYLQWKNSLSQ